MGSRKHKYYGSLAILLLFAIVVSIYIASLYNQNKLFKDPEEEQRLKLVCYYTLPNANSSLQPQSLDAYLCTHIIVGFSPIRNNSIIIDESHESVYKDIVDLKQINNNLNILLSIGGANNDNGFSLMIQNHQNRKKFIQSLKAILYKYNLDGVDLDWEFPGLHYLNSQKVRNRERQHFSQLIREIRMEYNRERRPYILSVAVAAPKTIVDISYDIKELNKYTDFVNIMTYDFHFYSKLTPFTGLNSPLYGSRDEILYWSTLNINYTVNYWVTKGMEKEKIMIGLPTYGHSFTLRNPMNSRIQSPASGFGTVGIDGFATYSEICWFMNHNIYVNVKFDDNACSPYMSSGNEWISYESLESMKCKANYIRHNGFGGAMVYSLNNDDFQTKCKNKGRLKQIARFPLVNQVKESLIFYT